MANLTPLHTYTEQQRIDARKAKFKAKKPAFGKRKKTEAAWNNYAATYNRWVKKLKDKAASYKLKTKGGMTERQRVTDFMSKQNR